MDHRPLLLISLGAWATAAGAAHAEDQSLIMARSGLWSDSLRGHDTVNVRTPRVPMYGLSYVGRTPFDELTVAVTGMVGQSKDSATQEAERVSGEVTFTGNTNQQFGFAAGYRYERATDTNTGATPGSVQTELNSVRVGFVGSSPLFKDDRQRVVTAFYVAGGSQTTNDSNPATEDSSRVFGGPEVIVAYVVTLRERYVVDLRYRAALYASDFDRASRSQTQSAVFLSVGYRLGK